MSNNLIGMEYLQNVYHNDISIFKTKNKFEISYVAVVYGNEATRAENHDVFLKHYVCYSDSEARSISEGTMPLESYKYETIPLSKFKMSMHNGMIMYSYRVSFILEEQNFQSLSVFSCLTKNPSAFLYNGPVFSDILINSDKRPANSNFIFLKDGIEYGGAVHEHEGVFMEGSFHTDQPHEVLTKSNKQDSRILFLNDITYEDKRIQRDHTSFIKAFPFVEDRDGNVSFVFCLNLSEIAINNSLFSQKLFSQNQSLFLELSKFLTVKNIKIYREIRKTFTSRNKLGMPVEKNDVKDSTLICDVHPKDNYLEKIKRFELKNKQTVNVNEENLPVTTDTHKPSQNSVSLDNLNDAKIVSSISQIDPSEDSLSFYQITDYEIKNMIDDKLNFSIYLEVENYISKYITNLIKDLNSTIEVLLSYDKEISINNYYDETTLSFKKQFLEMVYSDGNVEINENLEPVERDRENIRNLFFYKAVQTFYQCTQLLGRSDYNYQNLFNCLNPMRTNIIMFKKAIKIFTDLKNILETKYIQTKNPYSKGNNYIETSVYNSQKMDGIIEINYKIQESYEKSINQKIGYTFLSNEKFNEIYKTNSQKINSRGIAERNKFFLGDIAETDPVVSGLKQDHKSGFLDFQSKMHTYYTPMTIKIGNKEKLLDDFNSRTTEQSFFNILNYSRQANQIREEIVTSESQYLAAATPAVSIYDPPKNSLFLLLSEEGYYVESDKFLNNSFFSNGLPIAKTIDINDIFSNKEVYAMVQKSIVAKKTVSPIKVSDYDLTNTYNRFVNTDINMSEIPMQIKSIMGSPSKAVKNNFADNNFNDLQDPQTSETIRQLFLNIKRIRAFVGFANRDGIYNLDDPQFVDLDYKNFLNLSNKNFMCVLENYEIQSSQKREEKDFKILDNFFLVQNRPEQLKRNNVFVAKNLNLSLHKKDYYSRSLTVKQNVANFGKALLFRKKIISSTTPTTNTAAPAANQQAIMGSTNVQY